MHQHATNWKWYIIWWNERSLYLASHLILDKASDITVTVSVQWLNCHTLCIHIARNIFAAVFIRFYSYRPTCCSSLRIHVIRRNIFHFWMLPVSGLLPQYIWEGEGERTRSGKVAHSEGRRERYERGARRTAKKWKFIETIIRSGGFAHSLTTRMLSGLRKIEFTGKFYTDRALLHFCWYLAVSKLREKETSKRK